MSVLEGAADARCMPRTARSGDLSGFSRAESLDRTRPGMIPLTGGLRYLEENRPFFTGARRMLRRRYTRPAGKAADGPGRRG